MSWQYDQRTSMYDSKRFGSRVHLGNMYVGLRPVELRSEPLA